MLWYCLHVASNTEQQVSDRLADAEIESYYPHKMQPSRDGRRMVRRKLFPGYVFARFELRYRTPVIDIPQVIRILGWTPGIPAPIPTSEIEAVRTMAQSASASVTTHPYMAAGDAIVIRCGPLQGLEGFVVHTKGQARVVVSVTMLGRSISAEVAAEDIGARTISQDQGLQPSCPIHLPPSQQVPVFASTGP